MKTLVIDCSSLCYTSAHTLRGLEADEVEVGVIFGFLRQILSIAQKFKSNDFVFCWDSKSSKRTEVFPEYKVKRGKKKKDDPELAAIFAATYTQIHKLKYSILPNMGVLHSFEQEGYEADDLIADVVFGYPNCIIVTGDEDMFQLLEYADVWMPSKKKLVTSKTFLKEYGISSSKWADVKSLGGCRTDEVPGIPIPDDTGGWSKRGVGQGTAIKFLKGELPKHWKAYKAIDSPHGLDICMRNDKLVRLPFKGTNHIILEDYNKWDALGFWSICNELRFESFMRGNYKTKWEMFFRGDL